MSEVRILIARKAQPEGVLEALPQLVKSGPIPLDIGLTAGYGRHWTGKRILTFLYADKLLEQSGQRDTGQVLAMGNMAKDGAMKPAMSCTNDL